MKMKQSHSHRARLLVGACALLMILSAAQAGFAQQAAPAQPRPNQQVAPAAAANAATVNTARATPAATPKSAAEPAAPAKAAETAKPGNDGIKIHGHWVLEVKNPDGKLVKRLEFDNSLVTYDGAQDSAFTTGDQLGIALLSGNVTPGDPAILFVSNIPSGGNPAILCGTSNGGAQCDYFTTSSSFLVGWDFCTSLGRTNCTVQTGLGITANFSPAVSWVLNGAYTVQSNTSHSITSVGTTMCWCYSVSSPLGVAYGTGPRTYPLSGGTIGGSYADRSADIGSKSCDPTDIPSSDNAAVASLTYTVIPGGPLVVVTGQIITVSVVLTFS